MKFEGWGLSGFLLLPQETKAGGSCFLSCLTQGGGGEIHYEKLMNSRGLLTTPATAPIKAPGTTE